jgi:GNAT superfamily N-acetyltransferase
MKAMQLVSVTSKDLDAYKIWKKRYADEYNRSGTRPGVTIYSHVPTNHWALAVDPNHSTRILWIKLGTQTIGFVTSLEIYNDVRKFNVIEDMYILPKFRRKGIAAWVRKEIEQYGVMGVIQDKVRLGNLYPYYLLQGYRSIGYWPDMDLIFIMKEQPNPDQGLDALINDKIKSNPKLMEVLTELGITE